MEAKPAGIKKGTVPGKNSIAAAKAILENGVHESRMRQHALSRFEAEFFSLCDSRRHSAIGMHGIERTSHDQHFPEIRHFR